MDINAFQNKYKIRYSELDCNLTLKPASLLQLLQDIASENAESLGFGYSFISKRNLAWFLLKLHIEFDKYPQGDITIKTEPRGWNRLFAFRDFEIINDFDVLGNATTTWGKEQRPDLILHSDHRPPRCSSYFQGFSSL